MDERQLDRFDQLGQTLRQLQEPATGEELKRLKAQLLDAALKPRRPRRWPVLAVAVASLSASAAAAAVLLVVFLPGEPLSFVAGPEGRPGREGSWLAADSEPLALRFSDGSQVSLSPSSSTQVQRLDKREVSLRLEQGSASFSVVKSSQRRWAISAGPFRVTVLGTQFDLHWQPGTRDFSLQLQKGSVKIVGPVIEARVIRAGETIAIALDRKQLTIQRDNAASSSSPPISTPDPAPAPAPAPAPPLPPAVSETTAPASEPASAAAQAMASAQAPAPSDAVAAAQPRAQAKPPIPQKTAVTRSKKPALPSGSPRPDRAKKPGRLAAAAAATGITAARSTPAGAGQQPSEPSESAKDPAHLLPALELAKEGRYAAAIVTLTREQLDVLLAQGSAQALLLIGDAARLTQEGDTSAACYRAVRSRFTKTPSAAVAAFALGRLEFDQRRRYTRAAGWFGTYLAELPQGGLVQEALGLCMEARYRAGQLAQARQLATRYLGAYPAGPHAATAQNIIATAADR